MRHLALGVGALLLCAISLPAQQRSDDDYLRDFQKLDAETRSALIRGLRRKIQLDPNPAIQRIVSMNRDFAKAPLATPPDYYRAKDWAKGVAPKRRVLPPTDAKHQAVRAKYPPRPVLPGLIKGVFYDWGEGQIVRRSKPLEDWEVLSNFLHGYPPGSDSVLAQLLRRFDDDPKMRKVAKYAAHLYADRDGGVYDGVTIYEVWYSGEMLEVPDVDAIPFARKILKKRSFRSPIPGDARRAALYKEIQKATFAYRKYRTLREAAAAAFLHATPQMEPIYQRLVPRFHYLFLILKDDPAEIHKVLKGIPDRDTLVREIDKRLETAAVEVAKRDLRKHRLTEMHAWLKYWAQLAVYERTKKETGKE